MEYLSLCLGLTLSRRGLKVLLSHFLDQEHQVESYRAQLLHDQESASTEV